MSHLVRCAGWMIGGFLLFFAEGAAAIQEDPLPRSNLDLQQEAIQSLAGEVLARTGIASGVRLSVRVDPGEEHWIAEHSFVAALRASGFEVALAESGRASDGVLIEIAGPVLGVRYSDPFRESFLGARKVARTVSARFACMVTTGPDGLLLLSETFSRSVSDTVRADDIPGIESFSLKSTRAVLPPDGFIDRIVEPFIIVGATGVAVYLLFNIRS